MQEGGQPEAAAREQVDAPDDRLDAVDPLEPRVARNQCGNGYQAQASAPASGRPSGDRAEEREPPDRAREHRAARGRRSRCARRGPIDRLDGDEHEREPDEQPVAAGAPLVARRSATETTAAAAIPAASPRSLQADIERAEREEALAQEAGQPASAGRARNVGAVRPSLLRAAAAPAAPSHQRSPFVEGDPPAQDEIDERRILARAARRSRAAPRGTPRARAGGPPAAPAPARAGARPRRRAAAATRRAARP